MINNIKISVIIATLNEEDNIGKCLDGLSQFDEVIVVDSNSSDMTRDIVQKYGVEIVNFNWDGRYPKKRQWILDNVSTRNDMIFFLDADEIVTDNLIEELNGYDLGCGGFFIRGLYELNGKILRYGQCNKKLALFDRRFFKFPLVDDLDIEGMGEIEGHYQPVTVGKDIVIGELRSHIIHRAFENEARWKKRHDNYVKWESGMNKKNAWPDDPLIYRKFLKKIFRVIPFRGVVIFVYSYFVKLGFLDGCEGWRFAVKRMCYYHAIR